MIRDCHRQISILKKELSKFYNQWTQVRRMNHGDEFDIDALHDMHIDLQAGIQADDKIYLSKRRNRKDLSILFLIDISLSSDSYINNEKVLDI
jgi:nitric oxide reductase NorD protein